MTDRVLDLSKAALPNPPALKNLAYHNTAKRLHPHQMCRAQDNVLTPGRRILLEDGMRGNPYSMAYYIDIDNGDGASPLFAATDVREVRQTLNQELTPGHFLVLEARCLPSGPTRDVISTLTEKTGDTGTVQLVAVFDDGSTTETITRNLVFDSEATDYGHAPDMPGAGFGQLQQQRAYLAPASVTFDPAELVKWTQSGVTVDLTLNLLGSVRPVDIVVYEQPYAYARAEGVTAGPGHIYQENMSPLPSFEPEYAIEGAASGDRRFGAAYGLNVAKASATLIGPTILNLGRYTGSLRQSGGVPVPFKVTGTTRLPLDYTGLPGAATPSYDISAGSYGRTFQHSADTLSILDSGVCRFKISMYWKTSAGTATARFSTGAHSYVDMTTASTSYGWSHAIAHLECGNTVLQDLQMDLRIGNTGSNESQIQYVQIQYLPE